MKNPSLHQEKKIIYKGHNTMISKLINHEKKTVFVKKEHICKIPTPYQINQLRQEYEFSKEFNNQGIRKVIDYKEENGKPFLIMEYIEGISLKEYFQNNQVDLIFFLESAIKIAKIIDIIHQKNIIHKDIKPENILLDEKDMSFKIIDFCISSKIDVKKQHLGNPDHLEGSLKYISPEQTGRMNRSLDYRSDLYSFGITLYEMLTGILPFNAKDNMALVYAHLAKIALPPHEIKEEIPIVISNIIMKLLEKNAEDRYQSAYGLSKDLQKCLDQINTSKEITHFEIGKDDYSEKFKIPEKLYGREKETKILLDAFDRVSNGNIELFLIGGHSGIGKTALVDEIHKPITAKNGYFISGKHDQYQRSVPYYAISQALNQFCRFLLTENSDKLLEWKNKILDAVKDKGQVLIDVFKDLELIIGPQPSVPIVGDIEGLNRFNQVFQNFIKTVSSLNHPLVLFLDDLQWVDKASLNLLKLLVSDTSNKYFLILCAYRDNEVNENHPFIITTEELKKQHKIQTIILKSLTRENVSQLLFECLKYNDDTEDLASLIYKKTLGNAFYVAQFINMIYIEKLLIFNFKKRKWEWDTNEIEKLVMTDNVVDLMVRKISKLSDQTQQVLKLASCLGNKFNLNQLAIIYGKTRKKTFNSLWEALEGKLIVPIDEHYKIIDLQAEENNTEIANFKFLHDRVQQASYSLIEENKRNIIHLKIGKLLLENSNKAEMDELIFEIVSHFNFGIELITDEKEKLKLVELNLKAGTRASNSLAYESAQNIFSNGVNVFGEQLWSKAPDLAFLLFNEIAFNYYRLGIYDLALNEYEILLSKANTPSRIGKIYGELVNLYTIMGKYDNAVNTAKKGLSLLGLIIPDLINQDIIIEQRKLISESLRGREVKDLANMPVLNDIKVKGQVNILINLIPVAWLIDLSGLYPWVSFRLTSLFQQKGIEPASSFTFITTGNILCAIFNEYDLGYEYDELGISICEKFPNLFWKGAAKAVSAGCGARIFKAQKRINNELYHSGIDDCIQGGAYMHATYGYTWFFSLEVFSKMTLNEVYEVYSKYTSFFNDIPNEETEMTNSYQLRFVESLIDKKQVGFNEEEYLNVITSNKLLYACANYYVNKIILNYLFDRFQENLELQPLFISYQLNIMGQFTQVQCILFEALSITAVYQKITDEDLKEELYLKLQEHLKMLNLLKQSCPDNYESIYYLLLAEIYKIDNKNVKLVMELYSKSIICAIGKSKVLIFEALANELCAKYCLELGLDVVGAKFLLEAIEVYNAWGAITKVNYLYSKYKDFLSKNYLLTNKGNNISSNLSQFTTYTKTSSYSLDSASLVKASQTLSQEVKLEKLISKMLEIVLQNAGAELVVILENNNNELFVRGTLNKENEAEIYREKNNNNFINLPFSVIRYVSQSYLPAILHEAVNDNTYCNDKYIQTNKVKSLMCVPILRKSELLGIIYLENNLSSGMFTPQRIAIVEHLSSQIAISLENAYMYENLEKKVKERTQTILKQKQEIEHRNSQITASIQYAKVIQNAILTPKEILKKCFEGYFLLYKPKDIVSGDFYWYSKINNSIFCIVADCTGHGVPGAFMSMIGTRLLDEIINKQLITDPSEILRKLHQSIFHSLNQKKSDVRDGMDLSICKLTQISNIKYELVFSGAKSTAYLIKNKELIKLKGSRVSIGGYEILKREINNQTYEISKGDTIYLFSDGYLDQMNSQRKKIGSLKFEKIISEIQCYPINAQEKVLNNYLLDHQGENIQIDDITIWGIKL